MQRARDEFLPVPVSPRMQCGFARGYAFHLRYHATHVSPCHTIRVCRGGCQIAIFALEAPSFRRSPRQEDFSVEIGFQKVERAQALARTAISMCAGLTS